MPIIERSGAINSPEDPDASTVRRITVVVHHFSGRPTSPPTCRTDAAASGEAGAGKPGDRHRHRRSGTGRHHLRDHSWLGLVERVLLSWPVTLRLALLIAVLVTGTAALAAVVGVVGQVLLALLGLRTQRLRQEWLRELRARQAAASSPERR